jgi:hypothetical protein
VLHPARRSLAGVFGQRPAVHPWQAREQTAQEPAQPTAGLGPGEPVVKLGREPVERGV